MLKLYCKGKNADVTHSLVHMHTSTMFFAIHEMWIDLVWFITRYIFLNSLLGPYYCLDTKFQTFFVRFMLLKKILKTYLFWLFYPKWYSALLSKFYLQLTPYKNLLISFFFQIRSEVCDANSFMIPAAKLFSWRWSHLRYSLPAQPLDFSTQAKKKDWC